MRSVIVTGGAGYIGSHVCKTLKSAGITPITLDNLSQGHRRAVKWGPLVEADISDRAALLKLVQEYTPFAAIHLASSINVRDSLKNPFFYYQNNVVASLRLLENLCEAGVKNFVFSSSAAVYGQPQTYPISEEHPKLPTHPYGKSKLMVEEILQDLHSAYGLTFAALRYFNASGADPEGEVGESHNPETHLIPLVLASAMGRGPTLRINGEDFSTPDGTAIRDYIHVTDLAEAHLKALLWICENKKCLTINLGKGQGYSVREIISAVERVTGRTVSVEVGPRFIEDPTALVADPKKAQTLLNWMPQLSSLETIISTAHRWHLQLPAREMDVNGR
ncbi:MAG: UDP-glucose 4-epimerase GalE [Chlamydiales bacterium]|nr:UDP-glucose 4-epimerase GalE [Chlamydiales bacterium]